jgi:hypothetical protein
MVSVSGQGQGEKPGLYQELDVRDSQQAQ